MEHYFFDFFSFILLFIFLSMSLIIGRKLGKLHLRELAKEKLEIVGVAESSVFGLLALLIAFTFSGAYDRFEHRKNDLVYEANMFDQAYNYTYIVPEEIRATLKQDMRDYLDCYIATFQNARYEDKVNIALKKADILEEKIWVAASKASLNPNNQSLAQVYLPAFNEMFEAAHAGYYMTRIHPPIVIFILLIGLSILGGFLVGYNSAESKQKRPLHSWCYVLLMAFTIYVIINMEYPRIGFISMRIFDDFLISVRNNMV